MSKKSAGILPYRIVNNKLEVLLVHPGGPFFAKKDLGSWSIPKGEFGDNEEALNAAKREFEEETGVKASEPFIPLTPIKQSGGKLVYAWAWKGNVDTALVHSNTFKIEWPPRSGQTKEFPEIDKAEWFNLAEAKNKIIPAQVPLLNELDTLM